jgi:hypothetical protein
MSSDRNDGHRELPDEKCTPSGKGLATKVIQALSGWTPKGSRNDAVTSENEPVTRYKSDDPEWFEPRSDEKFRTEPSTDVK